VPKLWREVRELNPHKTEKLNKDLDKEVFALLGDDHQSVPTQPETVLHDNNATLGYVN